MIGITLTASLAMLSLALVLATYRLIKGPMLPNRVVALELIASLVAGFAALHAVQTGVDHFIDVAIVMALLAFLAAIGFARYLEKGGARDD